MSNIYWIVAHYDERLGTNWTGIDEDRCVAEVKSFSWSDVSYPPRVLTDWVECNHLEYCYPLLVVDHDDSNRFVQFVRDPRSRESWYLDRNHDAIIKRWQAMLVSYGTLNAQAMPCTWQCLPPDGYPREGRAWAQYNGDLTTFEAKGGLMLGAPSVPSGHGVSYQPVNTGTLVASRVTAGSTNQYSHRRSLGRPAGATGRQAPQTSSPRSATCSSGKLRND